jgi:hypothetical protein
MAGETRIDIAAEAEETHRQIKALNRRLAISRTAAERESVRASIAAAKADWFRRLQPELDRGKQEADRRHREAMAYGLTPEGRLAENRRLRRHGG